jgi:hypothetical protein
MAKDEESAMRGDRGDAKAEPSGHKGDNPATAGSGETTVETGQAEGRLNPSSPGDTGTTPGTNARVG